MTCFLRVQLAGRDARPGDIVLINIDHVSRIHPTWPQGCSIVMDDDTTSLHVTHSLDDLQARLCSTGGKTHVYSLETGRKVERTAPGTCRVCSGTRQHDIDTHVRAQQRADDLAAEETYRDMLAHPETVVDAPELLP